MTVPADAEKICGLCKRFWRCLLFNDGDFDDTACANFVRVRPSWKEVDALHLDADPQTVARDNNDGQGATEE